MHDHNSVSHVDWCPVREGIAPDVKALSEITASLDGSVSKRALSEDCRHCEQQEKEAVHDGLLGRELLCAPSRLHRLYRTLRIRLSSAWFMHWHPNPVLLTKAIQRGRMPCSELGESWPLRNSVTDKLLQRNFLVGGWSAGYHLFSFNDSKLQSEGRH